MIEPERHLQDEMGSKFAKIREQQGWGKIVDLAAASGVSAQAIRDYEDGKHWPRLDNFLLLAATLEAELDDLLPMGWREMFGQRGLKLLQGKVKALGSRFNSRSSEGSNRQSTDLFAPARRAA